MSRNFKDDSNGVDGVSAIWRVLNLQDHPAIDPPASAPPDAHDPISASDPQSSLLPNSHHRLSTQSVTSLTSSRPAPPSPAVSRRASCRSRTSSRPVSGMNSTPSSRPVSGVQHPFSRPSSDTLQLLTPTTPNASTPTTTITLPRLSHDRLSPAPTPTSDINPDPSLSTDPALTSTQPTTSTLIQIRDYGFAPSDPRFTGQGPHVPRANRPAFLARKLTAGPTDDDEDEWENEDEGRVAGWEEDVNGWRGFKWGFGPAWARPSSIAGPGSFPSRGDLDRNFGGEDDNDNDEGEAEFEDEEEEEGGGDGEPPLYSGLYRALYAFEPEGTAEMRLDEDQLVRVIGRGGGVGWAVVVKDGLKDFGVHALVPESYLEVVRLDGEEDDM